MNRIKEVHQMGLAQNLRVIVDGKEYAARIVAGQVVQLHRVTQQAYGAREVGGSTDKFTSVSRNHAKFAPVAAEVARLVANADNQLQHAKG